MNPNFDLTDKNAKTLAVLLNNLLADEHILYAKTRNYHWNYEGVNFMESHKIYEEQYIELGEMINEIAERLRMVGHPIEARLKDFLKMTRLVEPDFTTDQNQQEKDLADDHETVARILQRDIETTTLLHEGAITDFLTQMLEQHEKMARMLRSDFPNTNLQNSTIKKFSLS